MTRQFLAILAIMIFWSMPALAKSNDGIRWQSWKADLFEKAKAENRFVLLDLEAVWCHWCHVMDDKTYSNEKVKTLIDSKYLPVKVDQDANPDLSNRYGDWGWPATIIFAPDGSEIVKLQGYIPPERMIALLEAVIEDPSPGPSVLAEQEVKPSASAFLSKSQRAELLDTYKAVYDQKNGGWGNVQKFIHTDSMDYAMHQAAKGDATAAKKARQTLDAAIDLIDPVWGGVYQYSDKKDWSSPHFEKIMWYQAQYIRHYAEAYTLWGDNAYLNAAKDIHRYLVGFLLGPEGSFYTSQNADLNRQVDGKTFYALDDAERRELGMPRIDKNIYARENGWAVRGLLALYTVTGEQKILDQATTAMEWVIANRSLPQGGFAHGEADRGGPFLGDTLAVGEATLDLYAATGERKWLEQAMSAGSFIGKTFKVDQGGFATAATTASNIGVFKKPVRQIEENIQLARFLNALNRYSGEKSFRKLSEHTMRYLASENITGMRRFLIGVVLADAELAIEPAHVTIIGHKDDPAARALHAAARQLPFIYKRLDWWDKREGPMINPDVEYPEMEKAAAFACANSICSLPVFKPENLKPQVSRMMAQRVNRRDAAE